MSYAIIRTGGAQKRVAAGDVVDIERLDGDPGTEVIFDQVLLLQAGETTKIGAPTVEGAKVKATIVQQRRGKKVLSFKFRRRKNSHRIRGHRQYITSVRITGIEG
jgi:large subunit ribosomal protein L21